MPTATKDTIIANVSSGTVGLFGIGVVLVIGCEVIKISLRWAINTAKDVLSKLMRLVRDFHVKDNIN